MRRVIVFGVAIVFSATASFAGPLKDAVARAGQANGVDWQKQYDAAKAEKSSGKKKMLLGAAAATVGVVIAFAGSEKCVNDILNANGCSSGSNSAMTLGVIADLAGSGTFIWGLVQFIDGNGEMNRLTAHKPTAGAAAVNLTPHTGVALELGRRSAVEYRVSW